MFWITPGSASHQAGWRQRWFASSAYFYPPSVVLGLTRGPTPVFHQQWTWIPGSRPGRTEGGEALSAKLPFGAADGGSSHPQLDPRVYLTYQLRRVPDRQQMSHCIGNCVVVVGFREGPASHGEIALFEDCRAGGNDQPDRRPPISDVMG